MGKRLRKQELLNEIRRERAALDDTLALLTPRQMTRAGVTRGGWSVKDVLAHLVEWQQMNLDWYAAGLRGEKPAMPAPGFTLRELPRLNEMIYRQTSSSLASGCSAGLQVLPRTSRRPHRGPAGRGPGDTGALSPGLVRPGR